MRAVVVGQKNRQRRATMIFVRFGVNPIGNRLAAQNFAAEIMTIEM